MSNNTCHHIHQMKGVFYICFIRLTPLYTLVYQNNKKYQGGGGPLCPMRWPPLPTLLGKGVHFESKSIWPTIKIMYPWNTKWVCICIYIACSQIVYNIACTLHRTVIGFKIVRIFFLNTIETLSVTLCPPFPYYLTSRLSFTTIKCTLFAFVHNIPYIWICMSCKLLKIFYYDRPKAIIDNICMLYKYTS